MKRSIIICAIFICSANISLALDTETHEYLNSSITVKNLNGFSLDAYLKSQLGLLNGVKEILASGITGNQSHEVSEWFRDGGFYEDKPPWVLPYIRSANHFHDPITKKGFTGVPPGDSAIVWSQKPAGQQWVGGHYSWFDTRENFYGALIATVKASREEKLAETFRGVGQLMHLIQDMSVPEHARNDFHALPAYEEWLKEKSSLQYIDSALATPFYPSSNLVMQASTFNNATVPVANLFDSNQYTGNTDFATTRSIFGLSEYTNANFFSPDTIFATNYPYPTWGAMQQWDDVIDPVKGTKRTYLRKGGEGEKIEHVAAGKWFYKYLPLAMKSLDVGLKLDDKVYADYATLLLPRAVGYSAALLDYFFRGKLTATYTAGDITFRTAKFTVSNATAGEATGTGDVSLVIRYKALSETDLGGKTQLNLPADDYTYKVVTLSNVDLSQSRQLTFNLGSVPLPLNFSDMSMQLVYHGPLGNETGSVAVSEWQAIDGVYTDFALSLPPAGVFAKTSDSDPATASFNELRVNATTDIPGGLTGGSISLELEYRTATTDQFQSVLVATEPVKGASYLYRVSEKNGVASLPQNTPTELVFDLSQLSVQATDVSLNIIYTMADGSRYIAVHDIAEPTPVDVYNNSDYSCIAGQWYASGTQEARAAADQAGNKNGIDDDMDTYRHNFTNIYVKFSGNVNASKASTTVFDFFEAGPIPPATMKRLGYVLTDYSFTYSLLKTWEHPSAPEDGWTINDVATLDSGTGFINQADAGYGVMYTIRGKQMWWGAGYIFDNLQSNKNSMCDWSTLP